MDGFATTRRTVLQYGISTLVLGSALPGLSGCSTAAPAEAGPYSVWREVRSALRASRDHSRGRAHALVEEGDLSALHRFVRDEIRLVSRGYDHFRMGGGRQWGSRATLRGGAGTAREKADLLAELVRRMGLEAEVVETPAFPNGDSVAQPFFRDFEQAFDPPIDNAQMTNWRQRLGAQAPNAGAIDIAANAPQADAITSAIREAIGEEVYAGLGLSNDRLGRQRRRTPVVKITSGEGTILYADPVRPDAEIGPWPSDLREYAAEDAEECLPIRLRLTATTTEAPDTPFELVSAEWSADQLAGRQVRIGFRPAGETLGILASRLGNLRAFTPILSVQALDEPGLPDEDTAAIGDGFTLDGDRIEIDETGEVRVNGRAVSQGETPTGLSRHVTRLEAQADASRFPDMRLRLTPRNESGEIVEGLNAADFDITDEGEGVNHLLRAADNAPTILFMADRSLSMPNDYQGETEKMQALADQVADMARRIHPRARVSLKGTNSDLWHHLLQAAESEANLVVYVTDGDRVGDRPDAADLALLGAGPRALIVNVEGDLERLRAGGDNIFDRMAAATGGEAMDAPQDGDTTPIAEAVERLLAEDERAAYTLTYRAPGFQTGERTARVSLGELSANAPYSVAGEARRASRKLASLRLEVDVGGLSATRTLAGHDGTGAITDDDLNAVHGAMFGLHMVAFEGGPPALSTLLDDVITAKLGLEHLDKTIGNPDSSLDAMIGAIEAGFPVLPGELVSLLARTGSLSGRGFSVSNQGLRTVLYSAHPVMNSDRFIKRVDLLPTDRTYVLARNPAEGRRRALGLTLNLNLAEAALFPDSTANRLAGQELRHLGKWAFDYIETDLTEAEEDEWRHLMASQRPYFPYSKSHYIGPADGAALALWIVHQTSANVYGILPDGSGGGRAEKRITRQLSELDQAVAAINLLATAVGAAGAVSGVGGVSLGIAAAYGQRLARLYAAVSMSVILMDASPIAPAVRLAIAGMACEIVKSITLGVFANAGKVAGNAIDTFAAMENIDGIVGLSGGNSPFSCPT